MKNSGRSISLLIVFAIVVSLFAGNSYVYAAAPSYEAIKVDSVNGLGDRDDFIMGSDVSMLKDIEDNGGVYYNDEGNAQDCLEILKDHGVNWIRLRIWNDPTVDENGYVGNDPVTIDGKAAAEGTPGGGGNCDLAHTIDTALRAKALGMKVLLDFHYSDFWTDPSKQTIPKAWKGLEGEALQDAIYQYTKNVLDSMKAATAMSVSNPGETVNAAPDMVQVGNESNNGILYPLGNIANENGFANWISYHNAAATAIREVCGTETKIVIHLANGCTNSLYVRNFDRFTDISKVTGYTPANDKYSRSLVTYKGKTAVDFDVIGFSFYSFWHGTYEAFKANMDDISTRYDKEIAVVELGYAFTYDNADNQANAFTDGSEKLGGYQATIQGQAQYVRDVIAAVAQLKDSTGKKNLGLGVFYWEPDWIPVMKGNDSGSPSEVGWITGGGNDSENRAMFDFKGYALPSLDVFNDVKKDNVTYPASIIGLYPAKITAMVAENINLPDVIQADYSDGSIRNVAVEWEPIKPADIYKLQTFTVNGTVSGTTEKAVLYVTVKGINNYVKNPGFENGETGWKYTNSSGSVNAYAERNTGNAHSGDYSFHYWTSTTATFSIEQTITGLPNGNYTLRAVSHGGGNEGVKQQLYAKDYGGIEKTTDFGVTQWHDWQYPEIRNITVTNGKCTIGVRYNSIPSSTWGNIDDFELFPDTSSANLIIPEAINSGDEFSAELSYTNLITNVYAQDVTVEYNTAKLEYVGAGAANGSNTILKTQNNVPGTVRIIAANTSGGGISWNAEALRLKFKALDKDISINDLKIVNVSLGAADGSIVTPNALITADASLDIITQPKDCQIYTNETAIISVNATPVPGGSLSYQWFSNDKSTTSGGTTVPGGTESSLQIIPNKAGTKYYYCVITNSYSYMTGEKVPVTATSRVAAVTAITRGSADNSSGSNNNSSSNTSSGSNATPGTASGASAVQVVTGADGKATVTQKVAYDQTKGIAAAAISAASLKHALEQAATNSSGVKELKLEIPEVAGAKAYTQQLPKEMISSNKLDKKIEIATPLGTVEIPGNMLQNLELEGVENITLSIGKVDSQDLSEDVKRQVGSRPVIDLTLTANGKSIAWNNPDAPVTVSIPYKPTNEELADPDHIIIFYIDGNGNLIPVTNARYDAA